MKTKTLLSVMLLLAAPAHAAESTRVMFDGTAMMLSHITDGIEISYIEVPADLRELGIKPGQHLLRGKWDDTVLIGEAFAFAAGCAPIAYPIRGVVDRSGALVIIGPQPQGCDGKVYAWGNGAVMRFEPPKQAPAPPRVKKPPPVKPKAKPAPPPRRPQPQAPRTPWENQWQWQWR